MKALDWSELDDLIVRELRDGGPHPCANRVVLRAAMRRRPSNAWPEDVIRRRLLAMSEAGRLQFHRAVRDRRGYYLTHGWEVLEAGI